MSDLETDKIQTSNEVSNKTSKKKIFGYFALAYVGAAGLLVAAVLPAEYGIDPLGIGKKLGITQLSDEAAPRDTAALEAAVVAAPEGSFQPQEGREIKSQTLTIDIPDLGAVEHKLLMNKGDTVVFDWKITGETKDGGLYYDLHGHPTSENKAEFPEDFVQSYATGESPQGSGGFTAPFSGYHGFYFLNIEWADIQIEWNISGYWDSDIELYREVDGAVVNAVEY